MIITAGEILAIDLPEGSGLRFEGEDNFINFLHHDDKIATFDKDNLDSEVIKYCICKTLESI